MQEFKQRKNQRNSQCSREQRRIARAYTLPRRRKAQGCGGQDFLENVLLHSLSPLLLIILPGTKSATKNCRKCRFLNIETRVVGILLLMSAKTGSQIEDLLEVEPLACLGGAYSNEKY